MSTISLVRIMQRLTEIDSEIRALEAERGDLFATIRAVERLTGEKPADEDTSPPLKPQTEQISARETKAKVTFPMVVLSILGSGPTHRVRLIEEISKRIPDISPTVLASSLARMTSQGRILKDQNGVYSQPNSGSANPLTNSNATK